MKRIVLRPLTVCMAGALTLSLLAFFLQAQREMLLHLLCVAAGMLLAFAVHELGHVLAGLAAKLQFVQYTVGFLTVKLESGALQWKENTNWELFGGLVVFWPPVDRPVDEIAAKWKLLAAGGPLLSLLYGLAASVLGDLNTYGGYLLQASGFISFAVLLWTAIPYFPGSASDGTIVWMLHRGGIRAERYISSLRIHALMQDSIPPEKWPAHLVKDAERYLSSQETPLTSLSDVMEEAGMRMLLYDYYLAVGDKDKAACMLLPIVQYSQKSSKVPPVWEGINSMFAAHHLLWGSPMSPQNARDIMEHITEKNPFYWLFCAARLAKQGNWSEARKALDTAKEHHLRRVRQYGSHTARVESAFLQEIERQIAV